MDDFKEGFFKAVAEGYGEPFPVDRDQAVAHENGDGLADFIRLELEETIGWDESVIDAKKAVEEVKDIALHQMERAKEDIERVIVAIEEWEG